MPERLTGARKPPPDPERSSGLTEIVKTLVVVYRMSPREASMLTMPQAGIAIEGAIEKARAQEEALKQRRARR